MSIQVPPYDPVSCPHCNALIRSDRLPKHLRKVHRVKSSGNTQSQPHTQKPLDRTTLTGIARLASLSGCQVQQDKQKRNNVSSSSLSTTSFEEEFEENSCYVPSHTRSVILISRRGKRVDERRRCNECRDIRPLLWEYPESNCGSVLICSLCKSVVFDRSFGSIDALDKALPGNFESNPRRH